MPEDLGTWKDKLLYVAAWLISTILLCVALVLIRNLLMGGVSWGMGKLPLEYSWETGATLGWWEQFLNQLSWVVVACVAATAHIVIETYYRKGIAKHQLLQRIGRVMIPEVIVVAVGLGMSALIF